jgi:hypothetical protein
MDAHRKAPEPDLMLQEALDYAKCGLAVFPVNGTIPFRRSHKVKDASIDPKRIQEMWAKHPGANIAMACGAASQTIAVGDGSGEARAELAALENKHGPLPATALSTSPLGHCRYFSIPEGVSVPHIGKENGSQLEIISDGHYILLPPSIHPSGIRYEWANDITEFAETPDWMIQYANGKPKATPAGSGRQPSQRDKLILIGLDAELWHDADSKTFATVKIGHHEESFAFNSLKFSNWLTREYGERYPIRVGGKICPSAPSTQTLKEAINSLNAKAASGSERQAAVRVAEHGGLIYLDLGTSDWNVVEVSVSGWRVTTNPPVRFIRPVGFRPLPVPVAGGHVFELTNFLNVASDADFLLFVSWLMAALRPKGPYPVFIVNGEQGSGKSIACRVLRRLIDPNGAELRSDTRNERDLLLAAKNGWVVALDNLSYVRNDLSDALCRIATKGAFGTRALYTNDEEYLVEVCRPVLLNGIPVLASRPDLTDRSIVCVLPTLDEARRRSEDEFWSNFESAAPRILGALLDGVSGALRNHTSVSLSRSVRMMDFAKWSEAAWQALGAQPGAFEAAYWQNQAKAIEEAIEADPVAAAVIELISSKGEFEGTATELLSKLTPPQQPWQPDRRWPKDATRLSSHLRRLPPLLRPHGIVIEFDRSANAARKRLIKIKRAGSK